MIRVFVTPVFVLIILLHAIVSRATPLETIVVTSSRLDESAAPDEAAQLDGTARLSTFTALQRLPGVFAFSNGGSGGSTYLAIRGGEPNFTLVLIDGIRVNDPSNAAGGAFDLALIDPSIIANLQVNRLGASAIHGPDALSGVVHIETLAPRGESPLNLILSGTAQTDDAWAASASATAGWQSGGLTASYAARDTGGLTGASTLRRDLLHAKLVQSIGRGNLTITGLLGDTDRIAFPEDSGGLLFNTPDTLEKREVELGLIGATYRHALADELMLTVQTSHNRQDAVSDTPAIPSGVFEGVPARRDKTVFQRAEALAYIQYAPLDSFDVVAGIGHLKERGRGEGELDLGFPFPTTFDERRSITSMFTEAAFQATARFRLKGALRWDKPNNRSARITGRASMSFAVASNFELGAGYATSYKLPSIFSIAYPLIANPELRPETGESFELKLVARGGDGSLASVRGFVNRFSDLIDFDPAIFTSVNRAHVETYGIEFTASYPLTKNIVASGSLAVLHSESSDDIPLRSRPQTSSSLRIDWQPTDELAARLVWDHASSSFSSSIPTGVVKLSGYSRLDAGITWSPDAAWSASLDVANLTDDEYAFAVGVPEPRINMFLTLTRRF